VTQPERVAADESTAAIDATNRAVFADPRSINMLLTLGDGCNVIFKK
jgi:hypothetical protein